MDVRVTLNQTLFGEDVQNVLFFSNIIDTQTVLQSFANSMRASWAANVSGSLTNQWSLNSITYGFLGTYDILYSVEYQFTVGILVGGNTGEALPNQTALLVSTQRNNTKPNRGRIYFGGYTETSLTDGLWEQSTLDNVTALVDDWIEGIDADGTDCFLRIMRRPVGTTSGWLSNGVDTAVARQVPATIRGRRRGG